MTSLTTSHDDTQEYCHASAPIAAQFLKHSIRLTPLCSLRDEGVIKLVGPIDQHIMALRKMPNLHLFLGSTPKTIHDHVTGFIMVECKYTLDPITATSTAFDRLFATQGGQA